MIVIKTGSIIFTKIEKNFDSEVSGESVESIDEAFLYPDHQSAEKELQQCFDEPENFEVWDIEIEYRIT